MERGEDGSTTWLDKIMRRYKDTLKEDSTQGTECKTEKQQQSVILDTAEQREVASRPEKAENKSIEPREQ